MKKTVRVESLESFFGRLGKAPAEPASSAGFADGRDLARALTPGRRAILETIKGKTMAVTELAAELGRDIRAVSRDLDKLEEFEMLENFSEPNPGHGRRRMVRSSFTEYEYAGSPDELHKRKAWLEAELKVVKRQLRSVAPGLPELRRA